MALTQQTSATSEHFISSSMALSKSEDYTQDRTHISKAARVMNSWCASRG